MHASLVVLGIGVGTRSAVASIALIGVPGNEIELESGRLLESPSSPRSVDRLVIRLRDRRVYLYYFEEVVGSYPIAIGKSGWETPTGTFAVRQMVIDPAWEHPWNGKVVPPGDSNPLGRRWIGFWTDGNNVIGFHGTPNENLVGQAVSHGCIRMKNADIASLFDRVRVGTTVIVEP